jgi:hypothetical protein
MKLGLLPLLTFVLSLLAGCASAPQRPQLTDSIENDGLVVAEVQGLGRLARRNHGDVYIKGEDKRNNYVRLYDNYLVRRLPPGRYTMEEIQQTSPERGTGGMIVKLPVHIDFTVRAGEVTNLGQLLLIPDESDPQFRRFAVRAVDNSADIRHFLQAYYPKLNASISKDTLAPGKYSQGQDLQLLRRHIALKIGGYKSSGVRYVVGPAGTLARLERAPDGRIKNLRLLDSPITSGLRTQAEQQEYDRFGFISNDSRLFLINAGQVEAVTLPIDHPVSLFLFRDRGVIITDNKFNLYTSNDNGRVWQHSSGAFLDTSDEVPPPVNWICTDCSPNLLGGIAEDGNGYYVYHKDPARLVYATYDSAEYQPITLPRDADNIVTLTARQSGLFLEKRISVLTPATAHPFFVRPRGSTEWETRYKPKTFCDRLEFLDDTGQRLRLDCSGDFYESSDGGVNWRR